MFTYEKETAPRKKIQQIKLRKMFERKNLFFAKKFAKVVQNPTRRKLKMKAKRRPTSGIRRTVRIESRKKPWRMARMHLLLHHQLFFAFSCKIMVMRLSRRRCRSLTMSRSTGAAAGATATVAVTTAAGNGAIDHHIVHARSLCKPYETIQKSIMTDQAGSRTELLLMSNVLGVRDRNL